MGVEGALKFAFYATRKAPRILLPATATWLSWIVGPLMTAFVLSDLSYRQFLESVKTFQGTTDFALSFGAAMAVLVLVGWAASSFTRAFYADITRQFAKHQKPNIAGAFYSAKKNFLQMAWIQLLQFCLVGALVLASVAMLFVPLVGAPLALAGGALSVYAAVSMWLAPVALVVEKKRGVEAIRRSFSMTAGNFWKASSAILVIAIVTAASYFSFNGVPYVGFSLILLTSLFFTVWSDTTPAAFYYEYSLSKKNPTPEKRRVSAPTRH